MGTEFDPFGNKKPMPTSSEDNQTDILQTDIKESHYALVHKDYEFIKFFREILAMALLAKFLFFKLRSYMFFRHFKKWSLF